MATKVITNIGQLVTLNPLFINDQQAKGLDLGVIDNAAILVEEGCIKWVGKEAEVGWDWLDKYDVINARNAVVTPGLIDSHTHLVFAGSRHNEFEMRLTGSTYSEIASQGGGIISTVKATRKASFEELYHLALERIKYIQKLGITTLEIKTGYGLTIEDEIKTLKVIKALNEATQIDLVPTFMGAHALPPEFNDYEIYTDFVCKEMIPAVAETKLARFCDVFCEVGYFSVEQSRRILYTAKEYGLKPKIHADEFSNFFATALALEVEAVSADHLVYIDNAAYDKVAASNMVATIMPGVSLFLNCKTAPARALLESGCTVAIASDFNPGSNMCENLQISMNLACFMLKMSPAEVLQGVTRNASKALALKDRGVVEIGKRADLTFFNVPSYQYIFYHYAKNHVNRVMVQGEVVI